MVFIFSESAFSQTKVDAPDYKNLFEKDSKATKKTQKTTSQRVLKTDDPANQDLDFKAPQVEFEKEKNVMRGKGGVIISQAGTQVQADQADMNMTTKQAQLDGNVTINSSSADISAGSSDFNFETETGVFNDSVVELEQDGYEAATKKAEKLSETKYNLFDSVFSTCHCSDGEKPWVIKAGEAHITQESYAHCYNAVVEFQGIPVLYTPYLAFPVKEERQSGLLTPTYGYSSQDGFQFKQPIFLVIDDSTDTTVSPFVEVNTRNGSAFDYREAFSKRNNAAGRFIYSNERPRDGDLRGTNTTGIIDPEINDDRVLGYYTQRWHTDSTAALPTNFISDIHYTGDDLALREMQDSKIGEYDSRYLTSQMLLSTTLNDYMNASLGGEYNQFIYADSNNNVGFQRLPEVDVSALKSFRPFGYNPLGAKLVTHTEYTATQFERASGYQGVPAGYDGTRNAIVTNLAVPFHFQNYFASEIGVGGRQNYYNLGNTLDPTTNTNLDSTGQLSGVNAYYGMTTAVERVYSLAEDSWLSDMASFGVDNQALRLKRLKNTIEPFVKYTYVPPTEQNDLPYFDSDDRWRQRSLVTYGYTTSLFGRFLPLNGSEQPITELTPKVQEIPDINSISALSDMGSLDDYAGLGNVSSRIGDTRQLATFTQRQAYDFLEASKDANPDMGPFSGVDSDVTFFPSQNFAFSLQNVYVLEDSDATYWGYAMHFRDDRGDSLKGRYTFNEGSVDQIEGNIEAVITERLRAAYYSAFDVEGSDFIKSSVALRVASACNCWHFDLGYGKGTNPDKEQVFLTFTFAGLGDIAQKFGTYRDQND